MNADLFRISKLIVGNARRPTTQTGRFSWTVNVVGALAGLWILTGSLAADEPRHADAITVFHCTFGEDWDVNYDGWPDRWVRKTGPQHPHFVNIGIRADSTAVNGKCLSIDLDGSAAAVSSPPIRVMPRFSYVIEAQLKNEHVKHSRVVLTLNFCDAKGRVVQSKQSKPLATTAGWIPLRLEPVEPGNPAIDRVIIGLQVERTHKGDLEGRVSLADVRLSRLPRITITTNNPANVYTELKGVLVQCELSGIPQRDPEIHFQLFDADNQELQSEVLRLNSKLIVDKPREGSDVNDGFDKAPDCYEASAEWRPRITEYGYYRVDVRMLSTATSNNRADSERELASRTIYLAFVPPLEMPRRGEFGWTLPAGESPLSFTDLSRLLPQVGINWVKVPVWFDADDPRRGDELIRFVELLGASNIEVVGVIDQPPASSELGSRIGPSTPIAELLSLESTTWAAALEPVMTRLSLRVRWWQLGRDGDTSYVGFPALEQRIAEVRRVLFRFGQDVRLGLNWDWTSIDAGLGKKVSWDFQQLCMTPAPNQQQFDELLAKPRDNTAQRWIFVEPPPPVDDSHSTGALNERVGEFVRRMISAKVHGADAIIVSRPFHDQYGLMRSGGMPSELLMPWRTTAAMLGGSEYLGQMKLPSGSENRVFVRPNGQVVMVAWNDSPVQETLYLGKDIQQIDILGRSSKPTVVGKEQVITVGRMPVFVLGLHEAVTRWRMDVAFEKHQVPSIFKAPHPNSLSFKNYFPQGVGGSFKIIVEERTAGEPLNDEASNNERTAFTPDRWTIEPPQANFQLAADQSLQVPFEIRLKNALYGKQPVRVDFKIEADELLEFSVYRELEVGTADLTLNVRSHLEKDGTLIIEQLMTNSAEKLTDLKCYLYAKGRRPERMQVYRLGPSVDRKVYRFPDGADLVGNEMLLEIEELNGPHVLRYRFVASAMPGNTMPEEGKAAGASASGDVRTDDVLAGSGK